MAWAAPRSREIRELPGWEEPPWPPRPDLDLDKAGAEAYRSPGGCSTARPRVQVPTAQMLRCPPGLTQASQHDPKGADVGEPTEGIRCEDFCSDLELQKMSGEQLPSDGTGAPHTTGHPGLNITHLFCVFDLERTQCSPRLGLAHPPIGQFKLRPVSCPSICLIRASPGVTQACSVLPSSALRGHLGKRPLPDTPQAHTSVSREPLRRRAPKALSC